MKQLSDDGTSSRPNPFRKWAVRIGIALLAFEIFYVVAANIFIRTDLLTGIINKKPEKTHISWDSAMTYLPGFATVEGFALRSQTKKDQIYVHVAEAKARISLIKLVFKTIHIRGVEARDVDFRYRQRLDRPPKAGQEEAPPKPPIDVEYLPEIPGFSNPPDPKPEDLYPRKKKKRPWTISITGAEVQGPIKVALNHVRIEGDGWVGGGVTVKPRESIKIHRGKLGLDSTTVAFGPEVATENLVLTADLRFETFPAKGAKLPDILDGISGELSLQGHLSDKVGMRGAITPGLSTFGGGDIDTALELKDGVLRAGSRVSLQSEAYRLRIMGLDAAGSASVSSETVKEEGEHVTRMRIAFGDFQIRDPNEGGAGITGTGLELTALWHGLSITGSVPATHAELVVPPTQIHDVSVFNGLIPAQSTLSLQSGSGEFQSTLEINNRVASGSLDLVADDIVIDAKGTPLYGDLKIHANLDEGDLLAQTFALSDTSVFVDDIINRKKSKKKQKKDETWHGSVEIQQGHVTLGKPMAANGSVRLKMYDTRPLMALLKDVAKPPVWLKLVPNVKDVDGTVDVTYGQEIAKAENLNLTGDGLEILGDVRLQNQKTDGRLYIKYKGLAAGVSLEQGKGKIILKKPRKWFDDQ